MFWLSGKEGAAAWEGKCPRALGFRSVQMLPAFHVLHAARSRVAVPKAGIQPQGASPSRDGDGDGSQHRSCPWAKVLGHRLAVLSARFGFSRGCQKHRGSCRYVAQSQQLGTIIWGLILHPPGARADAHAEVRPRLSWGSWSRVLGPRRADAHHGHGAAGRQKAKWVELLQDSPGLWVLFLHPQTPKFIHTRLGEEPPSRGTAARRLWASPDFRFS